MPPKPIVLIILDGFGVRESRAHNAIANARMPTWTHLWNKYPHALLEASGESVGLPEGQIGNSEVGHLTIGAGRVVYQDLPRIDEAIKSGELNDNEYLNRALSELARTDHALHLMGLVSAGGVHSHLRHAPYFIERCKQLNVKCYIHAFLDGRDTSQKSAVSFLKDLTDICHRLNWGEIASVVGRYYAMDRDKRWDRTQIAYELLTQGHANYRASSAVEAVELAYKRCETDEFVKPTLIDPAGIIREGDGILFMNFRADRARQLSHAFLDADFSAFERKIKPSLSHFLSLTAYAKDLPTEILFPSKQLKSMLGQYLSEHHLTQFRLAETEKYAHVTFFFNGGVEQASAGEEWLLIPSPKVATYDLQPEMNAPSLSLALCEKIRTRAYDFMVVNFANPDMVGHTGDYDATVRALETIDACLSDIMRSLEDVGGEAIITADHGNAECMFDERTQQPHTAHTEELVPFLYVGRQAMITKSRGSLADIAPTILYVMDISKPDEMTGESLVKFS